MLYKHNYATTITWIEMHVNQLRQNYIIDE